MSIRYALAVRQLERAPLDGEVHTAATYLQANGVKTLGRESLGDLLALATATTQPPPAETERNLAAALIVTAARALQWDALGELAKSAALRTVRNALKGAA